MLKRVCLCVALLFSSTLLFAQSAELGGYVKDQTGAVVPNATVELRNQDTGIRQHAVTNGYGIYQFVGIMPGKYVITVQAQGFKTLTREGAILNVAERASLDFSMQVGSLEQSVTVSAEETPLLNTTDASVSTVIDRNFVESLPLNGRSFNTLLQLTPGVVIAPTNGFSPGQFSIAGQRTDANSLVVDGVSANFGVSGGSSLGSSGTGSAQAFSALGGTSSLVSVEALQEFRIETSSFAPEFGRSPGGQVLLTTRSGENDIHGGVYEYFRNDVLDANDWFANQAGEGRAPERHNDFGGFLGGPILRDKTFFFVSYEGARLRLPQAQVIPVPSAFARTQASAALAPFLNAYPEPNGQPTSPTAYTAPFTGAFSNSATLDAGSIRIDHTFNDRFSIFGRYNDAPSQLSARLNSLNEIENTTANTRTVTVGANMLLSDRVSNTFRGNYSTQSSGIVFTMDSFGGAVPLDPSLLLGTTLPSVDNLGEFIMGDSRLYGTGPQSRNRSTQLNFVDDISLTKGRHQLKFGGDYRAIYLDQAPNQHTALYISSSVKAFVSSGKATLSAATRVPSQFLTQSFSLYGQDSWRLTPRLTLTYGLRWELNPAPSARGRTTLAAWSNVSDPASIALAPLGTKLWSTSYGNFAPRIGAAYSLTEKGDLILRAGGGVFYDLGVGASASLGGIFPNLFARASAGTSLPIADLTPLLPVVSLQPPFSYTQGFSPDLKLPRSYQWNIALEKSFAGKQVISATYVGQAGRDLLRQEALYQPNADFTGEFVLTQNSARSNYNALQFQYRLPLSSRLQALLNYTWSHSLDNASNDVVAGLSNTMISGASDYASSDFDVRHSFAGALTYAIPSAAKAGFLSLLTKDWSIEMVIVARSGFPFNAVVTSTSPDPGGLVNSRPDLVPGQPLWIAQPGAPGGKILNSTMDPNTGAITGGAFSIPSTVRQGTEGRNDIRGFGLTQVDLSVGRKLPITERLNLQFRADAFNLFNHPNFTNPDGFIEFGPSDLQSTEMLNRGLGGLNALFQSGGPRSLQLSLKLSF